jgi:hypothetical protein
MCIVYDLRIIRAKSKYNRQSNETLKKDRNASWFGFDSPTYTIWILFTLEKLQEEEEFVSSRKAVFIRLLV